MTPIRRRGLNISLRVGVNLVRELEHVLLVVHLIFRDADTTGEDALIALLFTRSGRLHDLSTSGESDDRKDCRESHYN